MHNKDENITEIISHNDIYSKFEQIKTLLSENNLDSAKQTILELHQADLADLIDNLSYENACTVFSIVRDNFNPELLVLLSSRSIMLAVDFYGRKTIAEFVSKMDVQDAVEFIDELEDDLSSELLELLPEENRLHILEGINYPEHTAGRVMSKKYTLFYEHWTVGQAVDSLRVAKNLPDEFHAVVVVNNKNQPVGTVSLCELLKSPRTVALKNIIHNDFKIADTNTSLNDLSYIFKHYALTVVPVISKAGKVVGTISIENMLFIIEEQAEDALLHFGGVNEIDTYETSATAAKQRFPWLFLNLIAACFTVIVINFFEDTIQKIVALASLMSLVTSMSGNAAMQTMTVTIMAITNKDTSKSRSIRLILKEFLTCGINGSAFALLGGVIVAYTFNDILLAQVFGASVIINFLLGGLLGSTIPIALDKCKQDPALSSGVIVAAFTDGIGFLIFLGLAKLTLT
ncbi:MAG: magnesium transporter [Rickettsiaceae bacterium]|nr:magnesium transporter [Rickettsiaceae bacterium]